jgi:hypothetical protein
MRTSETPFYLLIVAILFGWGFSISQHLRVSKELKQERQIREFRDSLWFSYHEIDSQVQVLLTGNPDSQMIYKTIVSESGNFNSPQFRKNRNLFGFHNGIEYVYFDHWKQSFSKFMNQFYCDIRQGESYCAMMRRRKFGSNGVVDYCMD